MKKLFDRLQKLFDETNKRTELYRALGWEKCHNFDWDIEFTIKRIRDKAEKRIKKLYVNKR